MRQNMLYGITNKKNNEIKWFRNKNEAQSIFNIQGNQYIELNKAIEFGLDFMEKINELKHLSSID